MAGSATGGDGGHGPSLKAMNTVQNRNNIDDINLRRTLGQFEREKALSILLIDHERLDLRDFLKTIKKCDSNELPESRHWLQGDMGQRKKRGSRSSQGEGSTSAKGKAKEAQDKVDKYRPGEEDFDQGVFKSGLAMAREQTSKAQIHMDIYSKRNTYADLKWCKDYFDEEGYGLTKTEPPPKEAEDAKVAVTVTGSSDSKRRQSESAISAVAAENIPSSLGLEGFSSRQGRSRLTSDLSRRSGGESRNTSARSDGSESSRSKPRDILAMQKSAAEAKLAMAQLEARRAIARGGAAAQRDPRKGFQGDFMKELLVCNARRRYRRKKKQPFEDRLNAFYEKVEELMEKEEELTNAELERKWLMITKGVKAALQDSSDEEEDDNNHHTI